MIIQGQVGPLSSNVSISTGTSVNARAGNMGDLIVSELHGRFYESTYRNTSFSTGVSGVVAFSSTHTTLSSAGTPIVGVWNPSWNNVNVVILQSSLQIFPNNLTSGAAPGGLVWAVSVGNTSISTGISPYNRKTLTQTGSNVKAFNGGTPLTGLSNALNAIEGADFSNPAVLTYTTLGSTVIQPSEGGVQNFDGSIIVPPGGVFGLFCTATATTFSFTSRLLWEEVPI